MKLLLKNCDILAADGLGGYRWIKNGYLGINGDTIDYIGETMPEPAYDSEKNMTHRLLCPGLINCHGHTAMTLLRGVGSDLPLQEWLFEKMMPIEDKFTARDIKAGNALALLEMISTGTTSYSDMYFEPKTAVENAIQAGIKANISRPVQCFNPDERYEDNVRVKEFMDLYQTCNGLADGRVLIDFAIHAEYTNFEHIVRPYSDLCREWGGRMHIHLSETKREHDECVAKYGKTPAQWFRDLGTFNSPTFAAHCVWVTEEDMAIMKEYGVSAVHNPTSNMKLGSGFAPIPEMLDMGINVALGTDGAASNNNLNMFEEMHLAAMICRGNTGDADNVSVKELFKMATVNGAKSQGRFDTGVIKKGNKADLVVLDFNKPHLVPCYDVLTNIVFSAQSSDVVLTMVDGDVLYRDGKYKTIDIGKVFDKISYYLPKILEQI